jgi:hypothetical protein
LEGASLQLALACCRWVISGEACRRKDQSGPLE